MTEFDVERFEYSGSFFQNTFDVGCRNVFNIGIILVDTNMVIVGSTPLLDLIDFLVGIVILPQDRCYVVEFKLLVFCIT